ncbi:MAG: nucleotide sugar dehydrogenase [Pseudomonadota bacterium]
MFLSNPPPENPVRLQESLSQAAVAHVAILGLGYVGLPIARAACRAGLRVTGIDPAPEARARAADGAMRVQSRASVDDAPDVWIIAVPTPLDRRGRPDLGPVQAALGAVAAGLKAGALVVLVSTCQPGATRQMCAPALAASGLRLGQDVFLAVSPERENPGQSGFGLTDTPRLVGALDQASLARAMRFWERLGVPPVPVATAEIAECAKLLENTYRLVNIALMGEMQQTFAAMGVPARAVVEAAATKPFGFAPFWPGLGAGGHCIPVDPAYLQREARAAGAPSSLLAAALRANRARPGRVMARIEAALGGSVAGRRILVAGVTYKPEVADLRGAAPVALLRRLRSAGALAAWHDPVVGGSPSALAGIPRALTVDAHPDGPAEVLVLGTPHSAYVLDRLVEASPLVVDPFGLLRTEAAAGRVLHA